MSRSGGALPPAAGSLAAAAPARARRPRERRERREEAAAATADRPWWHWRRAKRIVVPAFALLVLALLASHAREMDWAGAWRALRAYDGRTLAWAGLLAATSHALYGSFDWLGRAYTGHRLKARQVWATAFVCYVFNLNLGSLVGSVGLRLRLYSRLGLTAGTIARIIGFSMLTNWLGHATVGGVVLAAGALELPPGWPLHGVALRIAGLGLVAGAAAYLLACFKAKRREFVLRGQRLVLPSGRLAVAQLIVSMGNWSLMGTVIWLLLHGAIPFPTVLGMLLLAGVAGAATHVPGGLGVLEAVFLSLLAGAVPQGTLLGALLAYRALYYLLPLALAIALYVALEASSRRRARQN